MLWTCILCNLGLLPLTLAVAERDRVAPLDLTKLQHEKPVNIKKLNATDYLWSLPDGIAQPLHMDIADLGFDPREYDEFRFEILPEGSLSRLMMKIKAFGGPKLMRSWYSKTRTEVGEWQDCRFDMHVDDDGFWFKTKEPYEATIDITLDKRMQGLPGEPQWRKATVRNPRFVKNLLALSFDHMTAILEEDTEEVRYTYNLRIENRTDRALDVALDADSEATLKYFSVEAPAKVALKPGETRDIPVCLTIPRTVAMTLPPLYAERIVPRVNVPGMPDSDVVPLMGYRRWPMWAVIPIFHQMWWTPAAFQARLDVRAPYIPHFDRWKTNLIKNAESALGKEWPLPPADLLPPGYIMGYRCPTCKGWLKPAGHATFRKQRCEKCDKVYEGNTVLDQAYIWRYIETTFQTVHKLSLAWLTTGNDAYAEKAVDMLLSYAEAVSDFPISDGTSTAGGSHFGATTLSTCFVAMELGEAFSYLHEAPAMTPKAYAKIRTFLLNEAGQVARHCVYDSNMTAEHIRFYGSIGIATGYWPLTGEAISGEFGWHQLVEHAFSEDGIAHEAGAYHRSIFQAMQGFAEFSAQHRVNLLTARFKRVFDATLQIGAAKGDAFNLAYEVYRDPQYLSTIDGVGVFHGVLGVPDASAISIQSQVFGGAGYVFLRQGNMAEKRELRINYKSSFDRDEFDRLQTKFFHNGRRVDAEVGRIMYSDPNSKWMYETPAHSTIVVNGQTQRPVSARLVATDLSPDAPVALLATDSENPFYEGVDQVRVVALLGKWYVVADCLSADRPIVIDRYQYGLMQVSTDGEMTTLTDLPALPEAGKFKDVTGVKVGKKADVCFGTPGSNTSPLPMWMHVVSNKDMTLCTATTIGGWFGHEMATSFMRVEGNEATFLAAFTDDADAPAPVMTIDESTSSRLVLTIRDRDCAWRLSVDLTEQTISVDTIPVDTIPVDP